MSRFPLRPLTAVGDAHGNYHGFAAVLIHAGLMDAELNWIGGKTVLIQTGDILDRGPDALQIDALMDVLQPAARKAGGDIVRLVGNHELEILRKNYFITSLPYARIEPFRNKLIKGILSGKWQAAGGGRGFLFTHAGVCDGLYAALKRETGLEKMTETQTAAHINKIFKEAVRGGNYANAIFNVSKIRGGSDDFGGIFWEDLTSLLAAHQSIPFRQIVGHTSVSETTVSQSGKIIDIDTGMKRVFEGGFEYLKIKNKKDIKIIRIEN
jgi:hypothetical protein